MPTYLTLQCPSCGGRTRVAPGSNRFACEYCGNEHIFQLPSAPAAEPSAKPRMLTPRPRQIHVQKDGETLKLSWRWFSAKYIGLAFFCVVWDGFLCFWYGMAFSMDQTPWMMVLFPVIHLLIGVTLTYTVIAGFINRTTLSLDSRKFVVHHDPAPWPGEVNIPTGELAQLFCAEKRHSGKHGDTFTYELRAMRSNDRELKLITGLDSPDLARFLEQEIESYLRIENRPVFGELAA